MHAFPPPHVPPEHRNCKYSEMPEPYKSEIDDWLRHTSADYGRCAKAAKQGMLAAFSITAFVAIVAAIILA